MRRSYILIAVLAIVFIGITILRRDLVASIFTTTEETQRINEATATLKDANKRLEQATLAVDATQLDLETKQDALLIAQEAANAAEAALLDAGKTPEEIDEILHDDAQEQALLVEVLKSEAVEIINGISLSGKAEAARKLNVSAETSGQIISEPIASGTAVKKDDVLCELDPGTRQSSYNQAQAALATAQTQYTSTQKLSERGLASRAALQAANASLEQAQAAVNQAQRELERLQIRAPFDGILETQTAELGTLLQPGAACAAIIAFDRINLVGYAAESQVDNIKIGAKSLGVLRDDTQIMGQVTFVAATADPITRTYRIEVSAPNVTGNIRDGSSARINIALAGTHGHLVPQNALTLNANGELGVRLHIDGTAQFHPAEMVRDTPEGIWLAGLPEMAEIIVTGQEYAADGQAIRVSYREKDSE